MCPGFEAAEQLRITGLASFLRWSCFLRRLRVHDFELQGLGIQGVGFLGSPVTVL